MSNVRKDYKREIDAMCASDIHLNAEDILAKAESAVITDIPVRPDNKHNVTMLNAVKRITGVVAALILVAGITGITAGAIGYGPWVGLFSDKLDDDVSATLVKEGYFMEIGDTKHTGDFDITFEGITGDIDEPVLLFTFRTDNTDFYEANQSFVVTIYNGLEENLYDTQREDIVDIANGDYYTYSEMTAVQDENDKGTYYARIEGLTSHMVNEQRFVVAIRSIITDQELMLDAEWRLSIPFDNTVLKDVENVYMDLDRPDGDRFVKTDYGMEYELRYVEFGNYETSVRFGCDWDSSNLFDAVSNKINEDFVDFLENSSLVVDGVEYSYQECFIVYLEPENNYVYANCEFPSIDYQNASSISFVFEDTIIVIK